MSQLPPRRPGAGSGPSKGSASASPSKQPAKKSSNGLTIILIVAAACLMLLCGGGVLLIAIVVPAIQQAQQAARNVAPAGDAGGHGPAPAPGEDAKTARDRLKKIALAAHNFHDQMNHFPPRVPGNDASSRDVQQPRSFHAWLLPQLDRRDLEARLNQPANVAEPWDAAANADVYKTVIPEFLYPSYAETTGPDGYALTHFVPNNRLVWPDGRGLALRDFTDGLSNTMLAGQIAAGLPAWGKPNNGRDPAKGFAGGPDAFGGRGEAALVMMADGSVRSLSPTTDPAVATGIATPNGGEIVQLP